MSFPRKRESKATDKARSPIKAFGDDKGIMKLKQFTIKKSRIEMIPIVDSFFLILVYFIYAFLSMSIHQGVPLELPYASTAVEEKIKHHGISITEHGRLFWDKVMITRDGLRKKLGELKRSTPAEDIAIYLYGDEKAAHGVVVEVLDDLRKAGIRKVFIETEPNVGAGV